MRLLGLTSLFLAGCGGTSLEGRLVDALESDAPIAGERIVAKAVGQVRMTCQTFTATTDDDGRFTFNDLCLSEAAYELTPANDALFLAEAEPVPSGGAEGDVLLRAWRAPMGSGVYELSQGSLSVVPTHADLKKETIFGTEELVEYPRTLPEEVPLVAEGEHLVLVGEDVTDLRIQPLVPSEKRRFGTRSQWVDMESWWYVGTRFESDSEFERVEATPVAEQVVTKERGDRIARFIPGEALPAGRYVLRRDKGSRAHVVDFGSPPSAEGPAVTSP